MATRRLILTQVPQSLELNTHHHHIIRKSTRIIIRLQTSQMRFFFNFQEAPNTYSILAKRLAPSDGFSIIICRIHMFGSGSRFINNSLRRI